jgi:hypothetical protein
MNLQDSNTKNTNKDQATSPAAVATSTIAGTAGAAPAGAQPVKPLADSINPGIETKFWSDSYPSRPYAQPSTSYEEYAPAYQYGWESFDKRGRQGQSFDSIEPDLNRGWNQAKGASRLAWDKAKIATREAWDRVELAAQGTAKSAAH